MSIIYFRVVINLYVYIYIIRLKKVFDSLNFVFIFVPFSYEDK